MSARFTAEQELDYARRYRQEGDLEAARQLVLSHLRLVVAVARGYLGYGLPHRRGSRHRQLDELLHAMSAQLQRAADAPDATHAGPASRLARLPVEQLRLQIEGQKAKSAELDSSVTALLSDSDPNNDLMAATQAVGADLPVSASAPGGPE